MDTLVLSPSYPYMSIARHFGLDYGVVLSYPYNGLAKTYWAKQAEEAVIRKLTTVDRQDAFLEAMLAAKRQVFGYLRTIDHDPDE